MIKLSDFKLTKRIAALVLAPNIALLVFAGLLVQERWSTISSTSKIDDLTKLAPVVSALVQNLQRERGQSAGFIGSKGSKFTTQLPAQRSATDKRLQAFQKAISSFPVDDYGKQLAARISAAQSALEGLGAMRGKVTALSTSVGNAAAYFTQTNAKLLAIVEAMGSMSSDPRISYA